MSTTENINEYLKLPLLDGIELLNARNCKHSFPLHKHETYNISLILQNTFQTDLAEKTLRAPIGTIAITNPDELHATPCDAHFGNSFFTFYVPPSIINRQVDLSSFVFGEGVVYDEAIFKDFLWLSKSSNVKAAQYEKKFLNTLDALIHKYGTNKKEAEVNHSLKTFIQEIAAALEEWPLQSIADKYGINQYKLIRLFKKETGLTPKHFVLLNRIEKSKSMLRNGHPIFDVAIDCGFYDCPHFYKYFKIYTGVNPLEFQSAFSQ